MSQTFLVITSLISFMKFSMTFLVNGFFLGILAIIQTERGAGEGGMGKHVFSSNKFPLLRNREIEGKKLLSIMPFKLCLLLWN